jgi:hypothetical protein
VACSSNVVVWQVLSVKLSLELLLRAGGGALKQMKWMAGILLANLRGVIVGSDPAQRHLHSKKRAESVVWEADTFLDKGRIIQAGEVNSLTREEVLRYAW